MTLYDLVSTWEGWGLTDILLPFVLIFTIMFAILQKTKMLGEGRRNYNIGVAVVIALLVVVPHVTGSYPPGADVVDVINKALPNVSVVVVAVLMMLLVIGTFGTKVKIAGSSLASWIMKLSGITVLVIFGAAAGWWDDWLWTWLCPASIFNWKLNNCWLSWLNDPDTLALVIMILVFGIIVWFITKEDKPKKGKGFVGRSWENVGKTLKEH